MSKAQIKALVCKDIEILIDLLDKQPRRGCKIDIEGLEALRTKVRSIREKDTWKLKFDLKFKNINHENLEIPKIIYDKLTDVILRLKVEITERALSETDIDDCIIQNTCVSRPIKYGVQLVTYARVKNEQSQFKQFKSAWHLDKHIRSEDNSDGEGCGFLHPEYHFSIGGFEITKDANTDYGNIFMIDTPRLMHPPLDSILAIDFVLNNFYGGKAQNLLKSKSYRKIIERSKKRLWRPYFIALANQWESNFDSLSIEPTFSQKILGEI